MLLLFNKTRRALICPLQDKIGQIIEYNGRVIHATVQHVISRHCGRITGKVKVGN